MTLDQAIELRSRQLNGYFVAPWHLAEAIATIKQQYYSLAEKKRVNKLARNISQAMHRASGKAEQ